MACSNLSMGWPSYKAVHYVSCWLWQNTLYARRQGIVYIISVE